MQQITYQTEVEVNKAFKNLIDCQSSTPFLLTPKLHEIENKELILYGAGNMGVAAINWLKGCNVKIKFLVDANEQKRATFINGVQVILPTDISEHDKDSCIFVVCVVTMPFYDIYSFLQKIGCKTIYPAWDIINLFNTNSKILCGFSLSSITESESNDCSKLFSLLSDTVSRAHYFQALSWRILKQEVLIDYAPVLRENKYFPTDIPFSFLEDEIFVDCGAYDGVTIKSFLARTGGVFKKIYAFEPSSEGFSSLLDFTSKAELAGKVEIFNLGLGDIDGEGFFVDHLGDESHFTGQKCMVVKKRSKLDTALKQVPFTYLKIHVEGDELEVVQGGLNVIREQRPVIAVTIFHNKKDFLQIPKLLQLHLDDYSFYLRAYCYAGIETILYAFPNERIHMKADTEND